MLNRPRALRWSVFLLASSCGDGTNVLTGGNGGGGSGGGSGGTAAGAGSGGQGGGCIAGLASIALTPADSTVVLDGSAAAPIPFTATGTLAVGGNVALSPSALTWTATRPDDTPPGDIVNGVLVPYPNAGGVVTITATDGCVTGQTTVDFVLDVVVGNPGNPGDWTGMPIAGGPLAPAIVYPSDQTRFPRNLYRTIFQWHDQGLGPFRLTFDGPSSTVQVYTDGVHGLCATANPTAGCFEVDDSTWEFIAGSNAGQTATLVVEALDTSTMPPTIHASDPIEIGFSQQDVEGAIFYWSTTSAGIRRGRISQQDPEDYVVAKPVGTDYAGDVIKCVACHVVSRDGKYLAAPTQSSDTNSLWIWEVTQNAPPNPLVTDVPDTDGHGFATFSPDDVNLVAAWGGAMWMLDRATGAKIVDLDLGGLDGTHPDWSPLGGELVFATESGDAPGNASLALIPWDGSAWGAASVMLPPPAGKSNIFPMFSPDGAWIAFTQGKGGHGDNTMQLFVVDAPFGSAPIELIQANRMTSNQMTTGQYQNAQPTWAPMGDFHWVAFNTKREFGVIRPAGTQQIWAAAIDPAKLGTGQDPSYPAFRVPFQGLDENNHRAFWTLDVGMGGAGGGGGGGAGGSMGCGSILSLGSPCDPLFDCCETGTYCDTLDSVNYTCISVVPN